MSYELIITEKPSAAKKIAEALADTKPVRKGQAGVYYYELKHNGKEIVVACAVGHLYTVTEKDKAKGWTYPIFDIKWVDSASINKASAFTKKYLTTIKKLAKDASEFTVATDFDIEGEVIGYNVIRFACKKSDAKRMKYSTLTKPELVKSYENASKNLIWGQVNAGVTRHELDWLYGINLSRALSNSIKVGGGGFKILSSGRVQGPALKILVDKEKEIQAFKPTPYWQLTLKGKKTKDISALHKKEKFEDESEVKLIHEKIKDEKKAVVFDVSKKQFQQKPPTPFDLTSLQMEAHRTLGIVPKQTLEIAQTLYTEGLISYPRTSSQKLPAVLGFKNLLIQIAKQAQFKTLAEKLLKLPSLKPNEGSKTDDAHPAIYPTGLIKELQGRDKSLYELIVRRFMAVFADSATRETMTVTFDVKNEPFILKGTRTVVQGWQEFYGRFVQQKEEELEAFNKGKEIPIKSIDLDKKMTKPPNRYTAASIIKELEKRNLGTKATRANIVENLYDRGYVNEKSIEATELGIKTCDVLDKHSPQILDEKLTRNFEEEMEEIRKEKTTHDKVIKGAKEILLKILNDFKSKEKEIGTELAGANKETINEATNVGKCPKCKVGDLSIRRGKFGMFIACNKYPDCKTTFSLPGGSKIKPAKKICEECKHPMIILQRARSKPIEACINPKCPTREPKDPEVLKEEKEMEEGAVKKQCPKCGKDLVLRSSFYGKFLGCSGFPKCRHIEQLTDGPRKEDFKK
ncbi:DNA topoisomerase I [Candidatus Woesearchaeota archaeon]|nr:MAG: DNA topoisomerase I [Candidatus Woesearchaeota archaeon]